MRATYCRTLRVLAITATACLSMLVVMTDSPEAREPWEPVPVTPHAVQ